MAFDYAKAYQQFIDEEFAAASATAWMIPEAGKVRFTGGRDIEISTLSLTCRGYFYFISRNKIFAFPHNNSCINYF